MNLSADVSSDGERGARVPKEAYALTTVSPGQEFLVAVTFHNGSKLPLTVDRLKLEVPAGWNTMSERIRPETVKPGDELRVTFRLRVPKGAAYTRPYWHRDNPETESINHVDNEKYATLPFPPPALQAWLNYAVPGTSGTKVENQIAAVVVTPFVDEAGKERSRPLAVVPAFSVMLEPGTLVISTHNGASSMVTVGVTSNLARIEHGLLRLELPEGWRSEPAAQTLELSHRGENKEVEFKVFPAHLQEGRATLRAVLDVAGGKV